jgi:hypothetical protein
LLLLLFGILLYGGTVWEPVWSTVDDGKEAAHAVEFHQMFSGRTERDLWGTVKWLADYSASEGLFRPGFILLRQIEHELFGYDCAKYHWLRLLAMLALCQLFFSLVHKATGSPGAAGVCAMLWLCFSPTVENWSRHGEASAFYPTAFTLLSVWCVAGAFQQPPQHAMRRWLLVLAACLFAVPPLFTKESGLALSGLAATICIACCLNAGPALSRANLPAGAVYLVANLLIAAAWFYLKNALGTRPIAAGNYSSNYQFSPPVLAATAFKYGDVVWNGFLLLAPVAAVLWARRFWLWLRGRLHPDTLDGLSLVGLGWFASILAIMLPWKSPLGRYLGIGLPGLSLFVGLTLWRLIAPAKDDAPASPSPLRSVLRWVVYANLVVLPVIAGIRTTNYLIFRHDFDHAADRTIQTLAREAPRNARLFMNTPRDAYDCFHEMLIWLRLLHNRGDLAHCNYNAMNRPEPRPGDCLLVFVREPQGRGVEAFLPESFHHETLSRLDGRLRLIDRHRYERRLLNAYPDAFVFNLVAAAGIRLPGYLGMNADQKRAFIMWEPSLVEWRIYQFQN